jgi:ubiquinone/menaquinone biosynthesis C-methylase UbiE
MNTKKNYKKHHTQLSRKKNYSNKKEKAISNLDLIKKNVPSYPKCFLDEYVNLSNDNFNYKKYYKTYESNQQIRSLFNLAFKNDFNILSRLLNLILKRYNPSLFKEILNIISSGNLDNVIYSNLKKLYHSKKNNYKSSAPRMCHKNLITSQILLDNITQSININNIKNYLDIGTGNGKFAVTFGKSIGLDSQHIYGVDLDNFAEQKDWNRNKNNQKFIFQTIQEDKKYPFEDHFFDIITVKMVLHHIKNLNFLFEEIKRILKNNGLLIIIEHSSFTYADFMLNDIEHGLYMNVFSQDSLFEEFSSKKNKENNKEIHNLGNVKYFSWIELDNITNNYGFQYIKADILYENVNFNVQPTRTFWSIYQIKK